VTQRKRHLLQYYDTNLYICDSREIPNATHQSSFAEEHVLKGFAEPCISGQSLRADIEFWYTVVYTAVFFFLARPPSLAIGRYYTCGWHKIMEVVTVSFLWILPFWYFCSILAYKVRLALYAKVKHKYQNGNINKKLTVLTSHGSILFLRQGVSNIGG
jgi:hypothetical protein